ncbi:hypothetical protein [Nocardia noduli]|uniref:hypothetical protein n=1 Tax=Nocardia noduli TaxID=2815722 RepID=UPI001C241E74|nr:hypothetical protein [Nocardia noduli]
MRAPVQAMVHAYPARPHTDWADGLEEHLERTIQTAAPRRRRPRRGHLVLAAGAAITAMIVALLSSGDPATSDPAATGTDSVSLVPATPAPPSPVTLLPGSAGAAAGSDCPARVEGDTVTSAERGDTDSGPGVILAFESAYYLDRSGAKARGFTTGDAALPSAAAIQTGIDSVPRGTTHCVRIAPAGPGGWAVDLSEQRPGQPTQVYRQTITTTSHDGRVLITGIAIR